MIIVWFCWGKLDFKTISLSFRAKRSAAWNLSKLKTLSRFLHNDKQIVNFKSKNKDETLSIYSILSFL